MTSSQIQEINTSFAKMRMETDELADGVIECILKWSSSSLSILEQTKDLFFLLIRTSLEGNNTVENILKNYASESCKPIINRFLKETSVLPDFASIDLLDKGAEVFRLHGEYMLMLLGIRALPLTYSAANGVKVLYRTRKLLPDELIAHASDLYGYEVMKKRLRDTSQFVIDVMEKGAFSTHNGGIQAIRKIRIFHAVIRYYIKHSPEGWDVEKLGEPINQQHMLGTLMAFSALILEGMPLLGKRLSTAEKEAYFHCWKVVGVLMGIKKEYIPQSYELGRGKGREILNDQAESCQEGREMTQALLDCMNDVMQSDKSPQKPSSSYFPKRTDMPRIFVRYGIERKTSSHDYPNILGIKPYQSFLEKIIPKIIQIVLSLNLFNRIIKKFITRFLQQPYASGRMTAQINLRIPHSLQSAWRLK